jgi:hypothetical protein
MNSLGDLDVLTTNTPNVRSIDIGRKNRTYRDHVGGSNPDDYFVFRLGQASSFRLELSRLRANVDVALLNNQGEVLRVAARGGKRSEHLRMNLAPGTYYIRVHATSGSTSYRLGVSARSLRNPGAAVQDDNRPVIDWNSVLLKAIQTDRTAPPLAARNIAIVNTAIYDAVNSIVRLGKSYRVNHRASIWASPGAAVAGAAYQTLVNLFPAQRASFDAALANALGKIQDGPSETEGFQVGISVANGILGWRNSDGANAIVPYAPPGGMGYWQNTTPAVLPQWPGVTPFAIQTGSQFRPAPPPTVNSAQMVAELAEVQSLGASNSATRTADQTQIANFWADGSGTYTPPGHWCEIAVNLARGRRSNLLQDARLFALLGMAIADAGIAAWDAKYSYHQWRPVTAIQQTSDPTWTPLLNTPSFPDYTSGHSTFSGAASVILSRFFGDRVNFSTSSLGLPGVYRTYSSFAQAADEAGRSRIFGGIHVESSNQVGLAAGRAIGNYVLQNLLV